MRKYKEISHQEVLDLLERSTHEALQIYVNNPFCPSICSFCCYQGILYKKEDYEDYYNEYLPKIINFYRYFLEKNKIATWFFGGGTPSLVRFDDLDKLFANLPNFSSGEKTFEIHPAFWDNKQLDVLKKYNFANAIICVQSFNADILRKVNRVPASFDRISRLARELKKRKIRVCIDLILFMDGNDKKKESLIFEKDISYSLSLFPEEITLQLNFQKKYKEKDMEIFTKLISRMFYKYSDQYDINFFEDDKACSFDSFMGKIKYSLPRKIIRFIRKDVVPDFNKFSFYGFMGPEEKRLLTMKYSLIGIGSYNYKDKIYNNDPLMEKGKVSSTLINIDNEIIHIREINNKNIPCFFLRNDDYYRK